jgi:predicted translin family RNA/ssDNA-binding protein
MDQWAEQLTQAEEHLGEAHEIMNTLKRELKTAGRKKDAGALDEATQRLARYGQLLAELRTSWTTPED